MESQGIVANQLVNAYCKSVGKHDYPDLGSRSGLFAIAMTAVLLELV